MSKQAKLTNYLLHNLIHTLQKPEKTPVSSIIPEVAYYPGFGKHGKKRPQDDKLIPYAEACIEIVRLLNDRAAILYKKIVEVCKEPECQAIFGALLTDTFRQPDDTSRLLSALRSEGATKRVAEAMTNRMQGHKWPPELLKAMDDFVLHGFNRDDFESPKVILDNSPSLFAALWMTAIFDTIPGNQPNPIGDRIKAGTVADLFGNDPKPRAKRRRKEKIIASFHRLGCGAVRKQTLMHGAELWYESRLYPGKLVLVCDELSRKNPKPIEESTLSTWIKPYDDATGYPR